MYTVLKFRQYQVPFQCGLNPPSSTRSVFATKACNINSKYKSIIALNAKKMKIRVLVYSFYWEPMVTNQTILHK